MCGEKLVQSCQTSYYSCRYQSDSQFLHRYLTVCGCEHKVLSHQGSPAVQATADLQQSHVGARVWGSFSAANDARTISP